MYYYLSFLRPPPSSIDIAVPSGGITITPQIANDLRTELLDDRPTDIFYTWSTRPPTSSTSSSSFASSAGPSSSSAFLSPSPTAPTLLTTYLPPSSTYKPNLVPLPKECQVGDVWYLGLTANAGGGRAQVPLQRGRIVDVWSQGIRITSSSTSLSTSSGSTSVSSLNSNSNPNSNSNGRTDLKSRSKPGSKSSGSSKPLKREYEGPKQTRIFRSWVLPPFGIAGATVSSSSAEDVGETVTGSGHTLINSRGTTGGRGSAGMTINAGLENGKPGRAVKRDSEGFPKQTKAQADEEEEEEEAGSRGGERDDENNKDAEDAEETGSGRTEERILSVVEETSFDLDKKIWDSGLALTSYLTQLSSPAASTSSPTSSPVGAPLPFPAPSDLVDRLQRPRARILEIGAGTGLVGIGLAASEIASQVGIRAMITDLPSAIPLIDENIELNRSLWRSRSGQEEDEPRVRSGVLDWDEEVPDWVWSWDEPEGSQRPLDVIVAADVTYNTDSFPSLISTLSRLFHPPLISTSTSPSSAAPLLLLAYKQRHAAERTLWPALKEIGIELTKFGTISGHEEDLRVDVVTGRDEEEGEEVRSGMGGTELWIGRKKV